MTINSNDISIIIPAKNEASSIGSLLQELKALYPDAEVIVVDDGSDDDTADICAAENVRLIRHPYSKGNGAAIKAGARAASNEVLVFMDADGQHKPADIARLVARLQQGYDMVVGARTRGSQASGMRWFGNALYNRLATWMVGHQVQDLTSGFRAVVGSKFREYLYMLPNGFSYPTTITMAFFRNGYSVGYEVIEVMERVGNSHIRLYRDGVKFLLIIFKIGTLYSPLRLFTFTSLGLFGVGLLYYLYTFILYGRFTNMGELLMASSVVIFMVGLVSEQISTLLYKK